jgi:hypothetical protein
MRPALQTAMTDRHERPQMPARAAGRGLDQGMDQGMDQGLDQGLDRGLDRGLVLAGSPVNGPRRGPGLVATADRSIKILSAGLSGNKRLCTMSAHLESFTGKCGFISGRLGESRHGRCGAPYRFLTRIRARLLPERTRHSPSLAALKPSAGGKGTLDRGATVQVNCLLPHREQPACSALRVGWD